jgi:hypothetical protein
MLCVYGTSADNLPSILANGIRCDADKIWGWSVDGIRVWGKDSVREGMIGQAFDSASCALAKAKDCRAVIVFFELDDEQENGSSRYGIQKVNCVGRDIKPDEIKEILISNDLSVIRGYFICLAMYRTQLEFDKFEQMAAKAFENSDLYEYLNDMIEWENVPLPANV